jgi:uncharacterized protein (TIGR03086 family)
MRESELFTIADDENTRLINTITPLTWTRLVPTLPRWNVRDLVTHLADTNRWVGDMLNGRRIVDVSHQFAEDPLDDNPLGNWAEASDSARAAIDGLIDSNRIVHLSYAEVSAREYLRRIIIEFVIHHYDLALALGASVKLPISLSTAAFEWFGPQAEEWRSRGCIGSAVESTPTATRYAQLMNLAGRET